LKPKKVEIKKNYLCMARMIKSQPAISSHLLWEYDLSTFDYDRSYKVVIERICERGEMEDWREMVAYYTKEQILETIAWSSQLSKREKDFSKKFVNSGFVKNAS
jgi:hypothetical protein